MCVEGRAEEGENPAQMCFQGQLRRIPVCPLDRIDDPFVLLDRRLGGTCGRLGHQVMVTARMSSMVIWLFFLGRAAEPCHKAAIDAHDLAGHE